jgi:hypothetical protein
LGCVFRRKKSQLAAPGAPISNCGIYAALLPHDGQVLPQCGNAMCGVRVTSYIERRYVTTIAA